MTTLTHYELAFRHPIHRGTVRERFPFEEGKYGEARRLAVARARTLMAANVADVALTLVRRLPVDFEVTA